MNENEKCEWEGVRMREGVEEAHAFQIEPMHMYARERKNTHTHTPFISVCVCVGVCYCGGLRPFSLSAVAFVPFEEKF